jgi:hypothetical protein
MTEERISGEANAAMFAVALSSRVDFVRVELVSKVLRQKHVLGKGQSQREVVVWGSRVFINKCSGLF